MLNSLTAVSPVDGRYHNVTSALAVYFSEYALIRYRVLVEVEYFIYLAEQNIFPLDAINKIKLRTIVSNFSEEDAQSIKEIEKITNHDVKAVEYFIKKKLEEANLGEVKEWVHFGLTSQDINNTAIPLSWKECMQDLYLPALLNLVNELSKFADQFKTLPMLARTHGQPASPTTMGKEWAVFVERLNNQIELITKIPISGKFGGATGNFNAHAVAFPKNDWVKFANDFLSKKLGIERQQFTTQIEHYDNLAAWFDGVKRINTILIDFCRDIWQYISMDYFKQKIKAGEIGSSAMPHKVNPIDFENAEGNLGLANAVLEHLSAKLPISRLQRDLTDSTVLRNIGVPMAHTIIALRSIEKGLEKLVLNEASIHADLDKNWAVVAEAIQTILRREHYPNPYEALKDLTRGNEGIDQERISKFINGLEISETLKNELRQITPFNYTGVLPQS